MAEALHADLGRFVARVTGCNNSNVLTDAIWTLLRAERYALDPAHDVFDELSLLSISFYPRIRHLQLTQLVRADRVTTRFAQADRVSCENEYVCVRGHRYVSEGRRLLACGGSLGCGYCSRRKAAPETSLAATHRELAAEWQPSMNGDIGPEHVLPGSGRKRYWLCQAGHTYSATPADRTTRVSGCGYCANKTVGPNNSLRTTHPAIASELDDELNGGWTADNVVAGSQRPLMWRCDRGHSYRTTPQSRTSGTNCLVCTHQVPHPSTCLSTTHPHIAQMWHESLNAELTPFDVLAGSSRKVWWRCENGCAYLGTIVARVKGMRCRYCSNRAVTPANSMRATHPQWASELDPEKNGLLTPDSIVTGTRKRLWWRCEKRHVWSVTGASRLSNNSGCPYCGNKRVWPGFNDMATTQPDLAEQFDLELNGTLTTGDVVAGTSRRLWWVCDNGHRWRTSGYNRATHGSGCPTCHEARPRRSRGARTSKQT